MNAKLFCVLFAFTVLQLSSCTTRRPFPTPPFSPLPHSPRQNATYTIVASGKLSANSNYYVIVSVLNATKDTDVDVEINGKVLPKNDTVSVKQTALVKSGETEVIQLKIGDFKPGYYQLKVNGKGGANFSHESELHLDTINPIILIQTDKAMYKPSQVVKFRFIVIDQNLLPIKGKNVTTLVKDSSRNVINKYVDITPTNGVVSHELQLSDQPLLGDWIIEISTDDPNSKSLNDKTFTKGFTIAEYVLPTFDVTINLPTFTTVNATDFAATVKATYTYGKAVKGDLLLTISDSAYSYWAHNYEKRKLVQYITDIDGEINIPVNVKDFVNPKNFYNSKSFNFDASVKDKLTGKVYNKTKPFTVYENNYKFELLKSSRRYIQGLPYTAYIKVSHADDTPVKNNGPPLKVIYSFGYRDTEEKREVSGVPENGIVKVELDTSAFPKKVESATDTINGIKKTVFYQNDEDTSSMKLNAEYDNIKSSIGYIYKASTSDECFTQLQIVEKQIDHTYKIGESLDLELITVKPFDEAIYYVTTKKGVQLSEKIDGSTVKKDDKNEFYKTSFSVKLDVDSAPKTRVLVQRLCKGNVIAEAVEIDVEGALRTPVDVTTNTEEAKPGSDVEVAVKTAPDSSVGLLGIDQRMLLLKSGNDIEKKDVDNGVKQYLGCKGRSDFQSCSPERYYYYGEEPIPWEMRRSGLVMFSNLESFRRIAINAVSTPLAMPTRGPAPRPPAAAFGGQPAHDVVKEDAEALPLPSLKADNVKVRQHFPETFIWEMVEAGKDGKATFSTKVPDTITSFLISSFAVNKESGFGLSEKKASLRVFRPFFLKMTLPYSIIRGESINIPVTVYNYQKTPQTAKVTLENEKKEFDFTVASEGNDVSSDEGTKTKTVVVPPNDGVTVSFLITPKKVGYIELKVSALSDEAGDIVIEKLLVKPEGEIHYINRAHLVTLDGTGGEFSRQVQVEIPEEIVADSERVSVSAIGDILGPAINNLDDLLRLPYGCGEQNMIKLVPNIVVLDYLTQARRLTDKVKAKAVANIETGYQRELTYKHENGSFSAFGREDRKGSTWLTAFVLKSLIQARPYANIDPLVLNKSLEFLLSTQREDGSFVEIGRVLSRYMQGKSADKTGSLTAYAFIAIATCPRARERYARNLTKAEQYLVQQLGDSSDIYEVSIITYALHLYDSKEKDNAYKKLNSLATKTPEYTYFTTNNAIKNNYGNVEITSYALMTLVLRGQVEEALPVIRYLISQQNSNGGFMSTQDTVIGLQALAMFASKVSEKEPSLKIGVIADDSDEKSLDINKENAIVLQHILLPPKTKAVKIKATGQGSAIVQLSSQYNQLKSDPKPAFAIKYTEQGNENNVLKLNVCTKYLDGNESGMSVMEVSLPSGYTADLDTLDSIKKSQDVKRVETKESNTVVVIYFDKITSEDVCVDVAATREVKLANLKPVTIIVYDYYDRTKKGVIFYEPKKQSTCDICEGADCDPSCKK